MRYSKEFKDSIVARLLCFAVKVLRIIPITNMVKRLRGRSCCLGQSIDFESLLFLGNGVFRWGRSIGKLVRKPSELTQVNYLG